MYGAARVEVAWFALCARAPAPAPAASAFHEASKKFEKGQIQMDVESSDRVGGISMDQLPRPLNLRVLKYCEDL